MVWPNFVGVIPQPKLDRDRIAGRSYSDRKVGGTRPRTRPERSVRLDWPVPLPHV